MNLESALIKMQRVLNQAWQQHQGNVLSQNEFDYLACIFEAQNKEPPEVPEQHDDSSHLSALAEQMKVRKSSASLMVNKLEKRGFIERVTCRYDARAQHILLTALGQEVYRQTRERVYGSFAESIKLKLGKKDSAKLRGIIESLSE